MSTICPAGIVAIAVAEAATAAPPGGPEPCGTDLPASAAAPTPPPGVGGTRGDPVARDGED